MIVKKANYGLFEDEDEAGKIADKAIITTFGKDAKTNGVLSEEEINQVVGGDAPKPVSKASGLPRGVFSIANPISFKANCAPYQRAAILFNISASVGELFLFDAALS